MKCVECNFWYQDEDEDFPQCHFSPFESNYSVAPCEYDDIEEDD